MSADGGRYPSLVTGSGGTVVERMLERGSDPLTIPARGAHAIRLLDDVVARLYDRVMVSVERAGLADRRRQLLRHASGEVVEIGAGTGANLAHLGPEVRSLHLLEPTTGMARQLEVRARQFGRDATDAPVRILPAPAEALPFDDDSVDVVVSTLVLCTVDDLERSLAEIRRVLHPDGRLLLIEHVAGHGRVAWSQAVLERPWRFVARGCNLRRDTAGALRAAGFDLADVRPWTLPGGGPAGPAIVGTARPVAVGR